jgi:DNA-binding NarL/FixJ family response regulator
MNESIHILVVDDNATVRNALRALFATEPGLEVVGEASNNLEALAQSRLLQPDVILMDLLLSHQDGTDAIEAIKVENPGFHILVLTGVLDSKLLCAALIAGASGYVLKSSLPQVLIQAIRNLHRTESIATSAFVRKPLFESG